MMAKRRWPKHTRRPVSSIGFGSPDALIVTAAMLDGDEHRPDELIRVGSNYSGNATHKEQ